MSFIWPNSRFMHLALKRRSSLKVYILWDRIKCFISVLYFDLEPAIICFNLTFHFLLFTLTVCFLKYTRSSRVRPFYNLACLLKSINEFYSDSLSVNTLFIKICCVVFLPPRLQPLIHYLLRCCFQLCKYSTNRPSTHQDKEEFWPVCRVKQLKKPFCFILHVLINLVVK